MEKFIVNQKISDLRKKNHLTQEKFASYLGVSSQAVSKWESGICCPDIQLLPQIAKCFDVSIDTLFSAEDYQTRAKLLTRYECTNQQEDFFSALDAYETVLSSGKATMQDRSDYGFLLAREGMRLVHQAEQTYEQAINYFDEKSDKKDEAYYLIHARLISLLCWEGKFSVCIQRYQQLVEKDPENWWGYYLLSLSYLQSGQATTAWQTIEPLLPLSENNFYLNTLAGEICEKLDQFNQAFHCWKKAFESNPKQISCLYSQAFLLEKLNRKSEAIEMWQTIIKWHHENNQYSDHETDMPLKRIEQLLVLEETI